MTTTSTLTMPAKVPLTGTMLLIRVPHRKRGFWVKFLRTETWTRSDGVVCAYVGATARKNRKTKEVVISLSETWSFCANDIVKPRTFTVERQKRLRRVLAVLEPGETKPLKTVASAAEYNHLLGAYSAVKSLSPEVTIIRGDNGVGVAGPY